MNGIRAAARKGFFDHIGAIGPDVLLLQEVRARPEDLPAELAAPAGWHVEWHPASRPGYSGTAVWAREPITIVGRGIGADDEEGRVLMVRAGGVRVASVYMPSGTTGEARQKIKDRWLVEMGAWMAGGSKSRSPLFLGGDFNVAHTERDLYYWKSNQKTSGFLPHEREWFGGLLGAGWHDVVREHHPEGEGPYTWWSNRGKARELDRGWRIDHFLANKAARKLVRGAVVHREARWVSDHAPVSVDIEV